VDGRDHEYLGDGVPFPVGVGSDDPDQLLQGLGDDTLISLEEDLAIIGTKAENDQIERPMALQDHRKELLSAPIGFKRVVKDSGTTTHPLLDDTKRRTEQTGKHAGPTVLIGPSPTAWVGAERIGIAETEYRMHRVSVAELQPYLK
jgi:hypothetical protein